MRLFLLLSLSSLLAIPTFAIGPTPFLGISAQINNPTGDFSKDDLNNHEGGAKSAIGGEIDGGIALSSASIYVGYRFGEHDASTGLDVPFIGHLDADGKWKINRTVVGVRFHLLPPPVPISPIVGGGVTMGKTTVSTGGDIGGVDYSFEESSKNSTGWFVEGGGVIQAGKSIGIIGSLQYHSFDAEFNGDIINETFKVSFFTLNAGIRIALM